jgi:hypothetical protein
VSANISAIFQGILTLADETQSNSPYISNIDLENPTLAATQVLNQPFLQVATSPGTTVSFSFTAYLILVWNRSMTNEIQINLASVGGPGIQELGTVGPGAVVVLMDPSKSIGWAGLQLTAIGAVVPATVILAG